MTPVIWSKSFPVLLKKYTQENEEKTETDRTKQAWQQVAAKAILLPRFLN